MARHDLRIRRCSFVVTAVAVIWFAPFGFPPPEAEGSGGRCATRLGFYNHHRRVFGAIGVECSRPHSPPWGNWGVESRYGRRRDGFQFAGWKPMGGWRQWNSCTVNHRQWRAPNRDYYNHDGYRSQKADPDNYESYASPVLTGPRNTTCENVYDDVHTYQNVYMTLNELDAGGIFGGRDDIVTSLQFGTVNIPISCSGSWQCSGQSAWVASRSNSKASADIRIYVNTWRK